MKDWIRSPSPNPDEEAERQRRYEELLAQSSVGQSAHASSSKVPITTPSPPPPVAAPLSPSQSQSMQEGKTKDADVCTPKVKRNRNAGGSEDAQEQPKRTPGTRIVRSPGSTVAKGQVTVVRANPRTADSGSSRSQAGKSSNSTSQTAVASVLGVASSPKSDPVRRSENPSSSLPPRRGKLMSLADMCFRTVLSHLSELTDEELAEIQECCTSTLSPRFSVPLSEQCDSHFSRLERLERAKAAALREREKAQRERPSSVALMPMSGEHSIMRVGNERKRIKVEKSKGGQKIWNKARAASGARAR